MEPQLALLTGFISFLMGITLGVFGAGGSILTVPILVYLLHYPPTEATHYSLLVVGIVSAVGVTRQWSKSSFRLGHAAVFAFPAMIAMYLVKKVVLPSIPERIEIGALITFTNNQLVMAAFAVVMMLAAVSMILGKGSSVDGENETGQKKKVLLALTGLAVGAVSGFVGAGGGFLIVPALIFFGGFPIKEASQASLFVIAVNSLWGFAVGTAAWATIPYQTLFGIIALAIVGMMIGLRLQARLPAERLKPAFGYFVLLMGTYILLSSR